MKKIIKEFKVFLLFLLVLFIIYFALFYFDFLLSNRLKFWHWFEISSTDLLYPSNFLSFPTFYVPFLFYLFYRFYSWIAEKYFSNRKIIIFTAVATTFISLLIISSAITTIQKSTIDYLKKHSGRYKILNSHDSDYPSWIGMRFISHDHVQKETFIFENDSTAILYSDIYYPHARSYWNFPFLFLFDLPHEKSSYNCLIRQDTVFTFYTILKEQYVSFDIFKVSQDSVFFIDSGFVGPINQRPLLIPPRRDRYEY